MIESNSELEFFDEKIDQIYKLILQLEVNINGGSFLINDEKFIKKRLAEMGSIGYDRYKRNFAKKQAEKNEHLMQPVLQFSLSGEYIDWHESIRSAEKKLGMSHGTISSALKRAKKQKNNSGQIAGKSGGFRWILEKDYKSDI